MDELLAALFAAAIHFSDLPGMDVRPPVRAMPYRAMLQEICADLKPDVPRQLALYSQCTRWRRMNPSSCEELKPDFREYNQCTRQTGLMAAYIIEENAIVYRDELDLENDADNSFIVHEYVHALQQHHFGKDAFETCQDVFASEKQAYAAQQAYLSSRGQLLKVGERLRFITCDDIK